MTSEELNSARKLLKMLNEAKMHVQTLRISAQNITPLLDGMPHERTLRSKVEELTVKILAGEEEVRRLQEEFATASMKIHAEIFESELGTLEKSVLSLRYAACLTFEQIGRELRMDAASIYYTHRTAKNKILKSIKVD